MTIGLTATRSRFNLSRSQMLEHMYTRVFYAELLGIKAYLELQQGRFGIKFCYSKARFA